MPSAASIARTVPPLALSIRQPYVEMILRGMKTYEIRSRPTKLIGRTFYLYAARTPGPADLFDALGCRRDDLPTGLILGVATVAACERTADAYHWHLRDVRRLRAPLTPTGHPQPAWFTPFAA